MKRTGEIILTIIGMIGYGLMAIGGAMLIWIQNNGVFMEELRLDLEGDGLELTPGEFQLAVDYLGMGGWLLIIIAFLAILLGIVAMVLLRGNKKPIVPGIILITVSILFSMATIGVAFIPGVFYFVASIMCFVRKTDNTIVED